MADRLPINLDNLLHQRRVEGKLISLQGGPESRSGMCRRRAPDLCGAPAGASAGGGAGDWTSRPRSHPVSHPASRALVARTGRRDEPKRTDGSHGMTRSGELQQPVSGAGSGSRSDRNDLAG